MKAFTSIEQSKTLAEILPIESADMHYRYDNDFHELESIPTITEEDDHFILFPEDVRCWSLAALLSVLPSVIKRKGKRMFLTLEKAGAYNLYYKSPDRLDELWETKEESIDACVAMIEDLHEQKIL